ncbi:MAG: hypothetical protein K8F91_09300, partial [Candidatus Obscuribacterales bacterium]|nr:hypothetical protein [Candidatus Obscuribacterales bacterium]
MQSRFKLISKLTVFSGLLAGMFAVSVSPGLAQGSNFLPGGGIQMGANGPVASFGPGGVVTGANGPSFG